MWLQITARGRAQFVRFSYGVNQLLTTAFLSAFTNNNHQTWGASPCRAKTGAHEIPLSFPWIFSTTMTLIRHVRPSWNSQERICFANQFTIIFICLYSRPPPLCGQWVGDDGPVYSWPIFCLSHLWTSVSLYSLSRELNKVIYLIWCIRQMTTVMGKLRF